MLAATRLLRTSALRSVRWCSVRVGSKEYFDDLVAQKKVVVFMKGTPNAPRCGFSNAVVQIFRMHGVEYNAHNVLEDETIRQGIKEYSEWPTIPQVYINKEFVGGCDILLQMHQNGELIEELQKVGISSALLEAETGQGDKSDK
ncbi:glutaredoxin-related protein 5, mitochondrial-like [Portunus trituberculatus]|uniref:Glutaredoxin-related protein 5, mitochondrial n=1 Tax=Portunus trituberculatus TaxID=210409 RepID=A0A5B7CFL6_PORTR|nr:glutaredoxin-related protein 5, mitochondrial-like [Portunus trituberculatus]MPC08028.1 Glutaredoxin-related protein 5, mitochondrial [Portunus trituberculatus]